MIGDIIEISARKMRDDHVSQYRGVKPWDEIDEPMREMWRKHARSMMAAISGAGYVVVPSRANSAMISAGTKSRIYPECDSTDECSLRTNTASTWDAMIAAAPVQVSKGE